MSVDSGCIGVCSTLFDEVCKGCGRTQMDVDAWVMMSEDEQREAVKKAQERLAAKANQPPI